MDVEYHGLDIYEIEPTITISVLTYFSGLMQVPPMEVEEVK